VEINTESHSCGAILHILNSKGRPMPKAFPGLRDIQRGLTLLNFNPGPIDGQFGARTEAALLALLQARGPALEQRESAPRGAASIVQAGKYTVREAIIHCSDTRPLWMDNAALEAKVADIRRWHMQERGWRDIGYHWLIDRDGKLAPGRAETEIGAHVIDRNQGTLGICLLGGHGAAATDPFERNFTRAQDIALRALLADIKRRTPIARVSGHNEWAPKACPGFSVPLWLIGA
jgi:peptidoglycan hydrolase-like protein with peptidoglycan-binding domain